MPMLRVTMAPPQISACASERGGCFVSIIFVFMDGTVMILR
jgi:hypothetical protein